MTSIERGHECRVGKLSIQICRAQILFVCNTYGGFFLLRTLNTLLRGLRHGCNVREVGLRSRRRHDRSPPSTDKRHPRQEAWHPGHAVGTRSGWSTVLVGGEALLVSTDVSDDSQGTPLVTVSGSRRLPNTVTTPKWSVVSLSVV